MGPRELTYYLALVVALARREETAQIGTFVDRHGVETLADALEYTLTRLDGATTMRLMAERNWKTQRRSQSPPKRSGMSGRPTTPTVI